MAAQMPASLKKLDIGRFALRAAQVESAKPAIAYWCNYWIAQQILAKEAHNSDDEAMHYTLALMDKLEKFKTEHAADETMTDDVAGKAYVEQFGLDTFARADNTMRANKVTKQTADTFVAAATFLELLGIWSPVEAEMTQKVKFAKYHALRILNAYKAGEDPNAGNPKIEADEDAPVLDPLDPTDPEVQALNGQTRPRQPSVVEAPDEADVLQARLARQSSLNESLHPSRAPSAPPPNVSTSQAGSGAVSPLPNDAATFYTNNQQHSPVSPDRGSSGGNYFPRMPSPTSSQAQPNLPPTLPSAPTDLSDVPSEIDLPSAPPDIGGDPGLPAAPTTFAPVQPLVPRTPLDSFQAPPSPGHIPPPFASIPPNLPQAPHQPHIQQPPYQQPGAFSPPATAPAHATAAKLAAQPARAPAQPAYAPAAPPPTNYADVDEEHILQAQKHARWAISALNFEDVPTAVKEFQSALRALGAG